MKILQSKETFVAPGFDEQNSTEVPTYNMMKPWWPARPTNLKS